MVVALRIMIYLLIGWFDDFKTTDLTQNAEHLGKSDKATESIYPILNTLEK